MGPMQRSVVRKWCGIFQSPWREYEEKRGVSDFYFYKSDFKKLCFAGELIKFRFRSAYESRIEKS